MVYLELRNFFSMRFVKKRHFFRGPYDASFFFAFSAAMPMAAFHANYFDLLFLCDAGWAFVVLWRKFRHLPTKLFSISTEISPSSLVKLSSSQSVTRLNFILPWCACLCASPFRHFSLWPIITLSSSAFCELHRPGKSEEKKSRRTNF